MFSRLLAILIMLAIYSCKRTTIDCKKFKNGALFTYIPTTREKVQIVRNDSIQIETSATGRSVTYKVNRKSPCEYQLIETANNKAFLNSTDSFFLITPLNIKITSAHKDFYTYHLRVDSADKRMEFSDTIWVEK